jgi:hypothetical protein
MNWTAISTVGELAGVLVVIVTLFYVAIQVRQNTSAILAGSRQSLLDGDIGLITNYIEYGIDPHFITDDMPLSPEDHRRFVWIVIKAIRIREFAWHQYQSGILDEQTWESYMAPVSGIFSSQRAKDVLDFYTGSAEFMRVLRSHAQPSAVAST